MSNLLSFYDFDIRFNTRLADAIQEEGGLKNNCAYRGIYNLNNDLNLL